MTGRQHRVVVLCYHSVHPSPGSPNRTPPQLFEQHLLWLRGECELVPFTRVRDEAVRADRARPVVAVTFDDGFADNHAYALPILARSGTPATFFVTTGLVERDPDAIRERSWAGWRDPASTLTWDQIMEMREVGMDIGGHGHLHRLLGRLTDEEVAADLSRSKEILEERLGEPVVALAYPHGRPRRDFSRRTMRLAERAGYRYGAAIHLRGVKASDEPMSIPRFPIAADPLDTLRAKVLGSWDLLGLWQERAPLWILRSLERAKFRGLALRGRRSA